MQTEACGAEPSGGTNNNNRNNNNNFKKKCVGSAILQRNSATLDHLVMGLNESASVASREVM